MKSEKTTLKLKLDMYKVQLENAKAKVLQLREQKSILAKRFNEMSSEERVIALLRNDVINGDLFKAKKRVNIILRNISKIEIEMRGNGVNSINDIEMYIPSSSQSTCKTGTDGVKVLTYSSKS